MIKTSFWTPLSTRKSVKPLKSKTWRKIETQINFCLKEFKTLKSNKLLTSRSRTVSFNFLYIRDTHDPIFISLAPPLLFVKSVSLAWAATLTFSVVFTGHSSPLTHTLTPVWSVGPVTEQTFTLAKSQQSEYLEMNYSMYRNNCKQTVAFTNKRNTIHIIN